MIVALVLAVALLAGCAPGANELRGTMDGEGETAGFLMGIWHGAIVIVTFIISLFSDNVSIYEVHNNGGWYNFGFLLGAGIALGGSGGGAACGRRRRRY